MKAIAINGYGEQLTPIDLPKPEIGPNEALIDILYTSVNPVDWKICDGLLKERFPCQFPFIPGWDAAGKIAAIGKDVKNLKVGDEVYAYCRKPIVQWGTYADYIAFDAENVARKPKNINFAQAAAIPLVALTAWQAFFDLVHLKKGEIVLIHAGAGGVGSMAIQFAKNIGAHVIATAGRDNHEYVKKLGAEHVVDYSHGFVDHVRKLFPKGVDVVLDCVGGKTLEESPKVMKTEGRLVSIVGKLNAATAEKHHITSGYVLVRPNGKQLIEIANLIEAGKVVAPQIEEMPLKNAAIAHDKNREGHTRGKIVLKVK